MDLRKLILTKNRCYKIGKKTKKKGVMWHSTGANNPNLKRYVGPDDGALGKNSNNNHWNTYQPGERNVCAHAFIGLLKNGKVATYQTLPWEMRGWHAGGTGNNDYIGFEICEDNLKDKSYFEKVYKEAVELTAYLCELHGWNPKGKNVIICHAEGHKLGIASNHGDVLHWFKKHGKTMDDVRNDVAELMEKKEEAPKKDEAPKKETTVKKEPAFKPYKVKITTKTLNVRAGAGMKHKATTTVKKNEVFTIVGEKMNGKTKWLKLKSGAGWISANYTKKV